MPIRTIEQIRAICDNCAFLIVLDASECSESRKREMVSERGWSVDIYSGEVYCPECLNERKTDD
jgi:predicted amidophosphoribosyltransferase